MLFDRAPATDPYRPVRGQSQGISAAILGSSPSVDLYSRFEGVTIGVNGASSLLTEGDIFLSDDSAAPSKSWFRGLGGKPLTMALTAGAAIHVPAFFPDETIRNELISDYDNRVACWLSNVGQPEYVDCSQYGRTDNLDRPRRSSDGRVYLPPTHPDLSEFEDSLPDHEPPHIVLKHRAINEPISRDQIRLNSEGTSVHVALQLAFIMGAAEIHLYGVDFSNPPIDGQRHSGSNYFYKAPPDEYGMTLPAQIETMDRTIAAIRELGTEVYSHISTAKRRGWDTRLTCSQRIDHK